MKLFVVGRLFSDDDEEQEFPGKVMVLSQARENVDKELDVGDVIEESIESVEFWSYFSAAC